jgi:hypothetical protein
VPAEVKGQHEVYVELDARPFATDNSGKSVISI